jgi:putative membrane protein insertion efficiency factor
MFTFLQRRAARQILVAAALATILFAVDVSRAPERQVTARAARAAIHLYQRVASPVLSGLGVRCRFQPTCSVYAQEALRKHGLLSGGWLSAKRIARCGPWTPMGTRDPAP